MDSNDIKKFKIAISIFVGALIGFGVLIYKTVPEAQKINQLQDDYKSTSATLDDAERRLEMLKKEAAQNDDKKNTALKVFFRPINIGLDTESAISDEFGEVLQLMRENKIKARSVKYDYDPQDDNFVKNAGSKYHVCRITSEMIATYAEFENFLRDLYKHEHFLEISKFEIQPYQKNKRILLINLQIKLYAEKEGGSSEPASPIKSSSEAVSPMNPEQPPMPE